MESRCRHTAHGWPALSKLSRLSAWTLLLALGCPVLPSASAQAAASQQPSTDAAKSIPVGPLTHEAAAALVPATVFFASKVAPVQMRNTGGAHLPGGFVLAGIVDTSGYSTGVQERYQAYLLLDTPARFGDKLLPAGAYGCGFVEGQFLVLDLGDKTVFSTAAVRDAAIRRPTPLQVLPDTAAGTYRLYFGRNYVSFTAAKTGE